MKIEQIPTNSILPYPRNAKSHPPEQIAKIAASIREYGFRQPVIIDGENVLIAGHGRHLAAQQLGLAKIPAIRAADLTPEQIRAYRIADNKTAESAWLEDVLGLELKDLAALGVNMEGMGFDTQEINQLTEEETQGNTDPDDTSEIEGPTITQKGDIYQLGRHKIMCGSCTSKADMAKLMPDATCHMLWTDPPYGVSYSDKNDFLNTWDKGNRCQTNIQNDHQTPEQMSAFWLSAFLVVFDHLRPGAPYYIAGPQGGDLLLLQATRQAGFLLKHMLIWVKNGMVLGRCDYHYQHEPILYGWKPGAGHYFMADYTATSVFDDAPNIRNLNTSELKTYAKALLDLIPSTVFRENKPLKSELHPTQKPVRLIARMIRNSTRPGCDEIVLDPFLGSGSTLIACEKTNRTCYGMEIEPHYCDVIVKRWEDFTGKKAERAAA